jgi:hypothetical protein
VHKATSENHHRACSFPKNNVLFLFSNDNMKFPFLVCSGVVLLLICHGDARSWGPGQYNLTEIANGELTVIASKSPSERMKIGRDIYGQPTNNLSQMAGVTYDECMRAASEYTDLKLVDWLPFLNGVFTFLMPSIALSPQLPMETGSRSMNVFALVITVGSPMMAMYSLLIASLTARRINIMFEKLRLKFESLNSTDESQKSKKAKYLSIIGAVRIFLLETIHTPLYMVKREHKNLARTIVGEEYEKWWIKISAEVLKKRQPVRLELIVALVLVILSQIFTVVAFFKGSDADYPKVGLGLAVLSVWSWMPAIVWGAAQLGCLRSANSISEALHDVPIFTEFTDGCQVQKQAVFNVWKERKTAAVQRILGVLMAGWMSKSGAIFTFARSKKHLIMALTLKDELQRRYTVLEGIEREEAQQLDEESTRSLHKRDTAEESISYSNNVSTHKSDLLSREGSDKRPGFSVSTPLASGHNRSGNFMDYAVAALVAFLLQWGTTGAALLIAYR